MNLSLQLNPDVYLRCIKDTHDLFFPQTFTSDKTFPVLCHNYLYFMNAGKGFELNSLMDNHHGKNKRNHP